MKQKAYQDLVELCKSVIPDCNNDFVKNKTELIRGNFRREHRKVTDSKRSGAGTDSVHVPKLWYYKLLLFLSDQEEVRQSTTPSDPPAEYSQQTSSDQADGDEQQEDQVSLDYKLLESYKKILNINPTSRGLVIHGMVYCYLQLKDHDNAT